MSIIFNGEFDHDLLESLKYETPFFLFSKKEIVRKYHEFKHFFPDATVHFAMKANSEIEVLKTLLDAGSGFEVASKYELDILKGIGVPAEKIVYGTSVKPASHIKEFFEYGVKVYAFDSLPELEKIALAAPGSKVYVRVSVNDSGSVFKFSEKFGTDKENIVPLLQHAQTLGLDPYGISFHVGSQASNPMAWANALESIKKPMEQLEKLGIKIDMLNLGGGFPCAYASTDGRLGLEEISRITLKKYHSLPYQPKLLLEPGRGIIATGAVLVATIIGKVERKSNTWLFLDTGVYDSLFEAMAYQGSTRYRITSLRPSYNAGETLFAIAGPTGDSPDIITREALLPRDINVGDKLVIHDVGAYSLVVSSRFNGFPKPAVYYI
jgi:ornithine decarboxylase